jgi:hypothetical protein
MINTLSACLALALGAPPPPTGVRLETWDNAVMAGTPTSTSTASPLTHSWSQAGVVSAIWSGSITPTTATAAYLFNCTFTNGYGIAWVDGHVLCTQGYPLYEGNVGPGPITLMAGKTVSIRLRFVKNTTTIGDAGAINCFGTINNYHTRLL